jgi:hypothetical protein
MPAPLTISASTATVDQLGSKEGYSWRAIKLASHLLGFDRSLLPDENAEHPQELGWIAPLCLTTAGGLMLIALAQVAAMHTHNSNAASGLYWTGITAIAFPISLRVAWHRVSRSERLALVIILGMALYGVKILHSPVNFTAFDEFLHWITAENIIEERHLFGPNSLLPISPLYPGLEILTTALSNLSGLSIFSSGVVVIGLGKAAFVGALFLTAESLSGSSRVAAFACVVFMSNANFSSVHSDFAYESLAFVLMTLAFLAALRLMNEDRHAWLHLLAGAAFAAALTVTHHVTSYFATVVLAALSVLKLMEGRAARQGVLLGLLAAIALIANVAWWRFTEGAGSGYLGPIFEDGLHEFVAFLASPGSGRTPFEGADGVRQPLWKVCIATASYLLTCIGLCTGFFRSLNLAGGAIRKSRLRIAITWRNSGLVLFTLLTIAYPFSILLRLTRTGWELGNRLGSFVSLGVCVVVAIAIAGLWQGRSSSPLRAIAVALALTIMLAGGVITGWGPAAIKNTYQVSADERSIESLGIGAAQWTRRWLGAGQRFATDRINQVLLASYGRQIPISRQEFNLNIPGVLFAKELSYEELNVIKEASVEYVMIDLRLTSALPVLGAYVDNAEEPEIHAMPPEPATLLKFNKIRGVSRPFDNGATIIYDVRSLHANF